MSTFIQSQGLMHQTHFTVIEIDLPVVEGACTISGEPGFGTPLSCDQPSNATRTYKFTQVGAPLLPESNIYNLVKSISETPAKLNSGRGLASRGSASISFVDMKGKDPNPDAPAVTQEVINQGSFFAKLVARNELTNKNIRIKNYRVESDGSIDLENGAQTRHYIIEAVNPKKKGEWQITCKDELSRINIGDSVWPLPLEGSLRNSVNDGIQVDIKVDANVNYQVGDTVRIGDELIKVSAVSDIGTSTAEIQTLARGVPIAYTSFLSLTDKDSHNTGDELYVCEVSDNERIDDLLERILLDVGVDASMIPKTEWTAEINEWHPTTRINTLWIESESTNDVLAKILSNFMIDMWFDPVARKIKISAISAWQESTVSLSESNEINDESISRKREETLRSTRAYMVYNKPYLTASNDVASFKKASLFKRTELESSDLFGEPKTKRFDFSSILSKDAADLLVNRWVNRYINPFSYSWVTPERKLTFNTGDVVDINSDAEVGFDGLPSKVSRVQITSVKPNYRTEGRDYTCTGTSYEPLFDAGSEIVIGGNVTDIDLYIQYAGAPSQPVELTFVFDGAIGGSSSSVIPAIKAGAFPVGSKLILILTNEADLQAKGGFGGRGGSDPVFGQQNPGNGGGGGTVYDAQGIDTDIYFSGATPSASHPTADGYIRAPSGGSGGFDATLVAPNAYVGGDGGRGGDGRSIGLGGTGGSDAGNGGNNGDSGKVDGSGSGWGSDGANNNASGGLKGRGVVDNGATVTLFGNTPGRYINGGGDH